MWLKIDEQIFRDIPGLSIGIIIAHDIDNTKPVQAVEEMLGKQQELVKKWIAKDEIAHHPYFEAWRKVYKGFGANPKKYTPLVENLITRVLKGKIEPINTLVDICNVISLKYIMPVSGQDVHAMSGDIQLTIAGTDESPVMLLGEKELKVPEAGEIIYKDEKSAIRRRFNWRDAERTKITEHTTDAIIIIESLPPVSSKQLAHATHELAHLIEKFCDANTTVAFLDRETPHIELCKSGVWISLQQRQSIDPESFSIAKIQEEIALQEFEKEITGQHKIRIEKVEKMRALGIDPWPENRPINAHAANVLEEYQQQEKSPEYHIAGRVMAIREHGKVLFAHVQDETGWLQLYIKQDIIGKQSFKQFIEFVDVGDIIWCTGFSFKTNMGEITLEVHDWCIESKCLYPLPDKFHGLTDVETKYRKRYLDLIMNTSSRDRFIARSYIIGSIRNVFQEYKFLEVETPMLHPIAGGAAARPFMTHHNALDMTLFLRIAPELYLKRLIIGGFERVYELNRCFRNEGLSTRHNPEFTTVEFYAAYQDYVWMMNLVETIIKEAAKYACPDMVVTYGLHQLDFQGGFKRITMSQAVKDAAQFTGELDEKALDTIISRHSLTTQAMNKSWGQKLFLLFEELVEPTIIQPTFITEFPVEVSPLAKRNPYNPSIVDRFELFIGGMELANGFNELNDPFDQAVRFKQQLRERNDGDEEAHEYDAEFIHALEYGLAPTAGAGIGIDRLVMILTNTTSIRDVILFPTLKKKES